MSSNYDFRTSGIVEWLEDLNTEDSKDILNDFNEALELFPNNGKKLIGIAQNFMDYDLPDAKKYTSVIMENLTSYFDIPYYEFELSMLELFANTIADSDYLDDKSWAKTPYLNILERASKFSELLSLANSLVDYQEDKVWAREVYEKAYNLAKKYTEYQELAQIVASEDYLEDKEFARRAYKEAQNDIETNDSYNFKSNFKLELAQSIANDYYLSDKVWAREIIDSLMDDPLIEPIELINIASSEELLNDSNLTKTVFNKAKEKYSTFESHLALLNKIDNSEESTKELFEVYTKELVVLINSDEERERFLEDFEYSCEESFIDDIKNSTLDQIREKYSSVTSKDNYIYANIKMQSMDDMKKISTIKHVREFTGLGSKEAKYFVESLPTKFRVYAKKTIIEKFQDDIENNNGVISIDYESYENDGNNFGEELELTLPPLEELTLDTNEPQHSLDECCDWIRKLESTQLTLDNPIGEFENGDYDISLKSVEGLLEYGDIPQETNAEYMASFKKHIEIKKNGGLDEELTLSEPQELELTLETPPEPSPQQTKPSDLKAEYANKIASGEIDPIETSFADFEAASQNKEIDYKAVYSQMISECRIDPTETTYDEMIQVSKLFGGVDESEYKATYSKFIGSGEIDPSETTYDEIVSIVKIFNEINGGSSSDGAITKEQLIAELKTFIDTLEDEDDKEIAIDDLAKDNFWYMTFEIDGASDELKRKVLAYYESLTTTTSKFSDIANKLIGLGDIENAVRVYKLAEEKLDNFDDAKLLGNYVVEINQEWSKRLYEKAYQYALKSDKVVYNLCSLAYQMYSKLNDKSWVVQIYNKALEEVENINQLRHIANEIAEEDNTICDKEWGKKLLKEYESKASTFDELYKLLESVISELYLNDNEWGTQVLQKIKPLLNSVDDCTKVIDTLCENKDLTREIFIAGILLIETESEQEDLAYYAEDYVDDEDLQKDLKKLTIEELKNKYGKPSTDELKKLYAAGIGDGSIDPIETSFDSFEKNYKA